MTGTPASPYRLIKTSSNKELTAPSGNKILNQNSPDSCWDEIVLPSEEAISNSLNRIHYNRLNRVSAEDAKLNSTTCRIGLKPNYTTNPYYVNDTNLSEYYQIWTDV